MAPHYPVFLDLKDRRCVVVGGGDIAERKVAGLLECAARVNVISPRVTPDVRVHAERGELQWVAREYTEGDLKGAFLAIAATSDEAVNVAVAREASREGVVLNVVDKPALCTFIAPAVIRRGEVTVALSTGGASPALARKMRESLEKSEVLEYACLAGILSSARAEIKRLGVAVHPDRWQECIDGDLVAQVKAGGSEGALPKLIDRLMAGQRHGAAPRP
jgi:precorrin-2 dehydrogenase/sirohydrochlorin ferrochelatase